LANIDDAELIVAGGPPARYLDDDPEVRRLRRLAADFRVADRVRMIGQLDRNAVPALIRSADVVVCAPWYEPFGMVPLEAMACGRSVVATAVGGLVDTVVDGATGWLVPAKDPRSLADAIKCLLHDEELRREFGRTGRRRVEARYSWPHIARATARVYLEVARRRSNAFGVSS
jgi:D-inositol-3-phosphate glycosyltransferase